MSPKKQELLQRVGFRLLTMRSLFSQVLLDGMTVILGFLLVVLLPILAITLISLSCPFLFYRLWTVVSKNFSRRVGLTKRRQSIQSTRSSLFPIPYSPPSLSTSPSEQQRIATLVILLMVSAIFWSLVVVTILAVI